MTYSPCSSSSSPLPLPSPSPASDGDSDCAKKSRRVFDFPVKTLLEYSFLRQDEAARALGVAPITLKRICQRLKYRWPYRMLKAQARREGRRAPKLQSNHSGCRSTKSSSTTLTAPVFSSPESEPRNNVDVLSSLCVHLPQVKSLQYRRHQELSTEDQHQQQPQHEPHNLLRLPSISSLTSSLSQPVQMVAPIRLPKYFLAKPQRLLLADDLSHRKLRPEPQFPLEAPLEAAAAIQLHGSSSHR